MCCTLQAAQLSKTIIYAGHAQRQGKRVAVLAYQNTANSRVGANAMVLPFPTNVAMGPDNIIDTREAGFFLRDLDASARHQSRSLLNSITYGARADDTLQIFESGSYTVILTTNVLNIPGALTRVPEPKRPKVSESFLIGYERHYRGWPIAVCCWHGHLEAEPLLWWYEPREGEQRLFIPTMDAHDGNGPRPGAVPVEHSLIWGSDNGPYAPHFRRSLPEPIRELMPNRMSGSRLSGFMSNGDTWATGATIERIAIT